MSPSEDVNRDSLIELLRSCSTNGKKISELVKDAPQGKGQPQPPVQLAYDSSKPVHSLPDPSEVKVKGIDLRYAIENRRSIRNYSDDPLTLDELAWLLWTTQGVRDVKKSKERTMVLRNVPSAGGLHPFETYLVINNVEGLKPGLYRYLSLSNELLKIKTGEYGVDLAEYCGSQPWVKDCALAFLWSFVPDRAYWRHSWDAPKLLMEAGHICQNLYLSAEAVDSGVCGICVFDLERLHEMLDINGDEVLVYIAAVGKRKHE